MSSNSQTEPCAGSPGCTARPESEHQMSVPSLRTWRRWVYTVSPRHTGSYSGSPPAS